MPKKRASSKRGTKTGTRGTRSTAGTGDLQAAIYDAGHNWQAAPTPISMLSAEQQVAHLGLIVDEAEMQATERAVAAAEQLRAVAAPPPAVDWRNKGGDWITSVKDQKQCGSCVSFGTLATLEARINIVCQNPNRDVDLSEAQLFFCGCGNCCDNGWTFAPALNFCKNTGVGLESSFPYTDHDQPCQSVAPYVKITNWTAVLSVTDRKNVLATKGPMVAGMSVFQDFFSYHSGVYRHTTGEFRGGHCISVVGYDDAQQCWICKNSWNTTWGESGFFKIGYGECGIDSSFAFYDIDVQCPPPPGPGPTSACERYIPLLRRVLEMARINPSLRLCLRYYVCGKLPRPQCSQAMLNVVRAVLLILRECPMYREPFCRALG